MHDDVRRARAPAALLDDVRSTGVDASGTPAERVVATGGEPLRCCLRDARRRRGAAAVRLPAADADGPYREVGAGLRPRRACAGYAGDGYPPTGSSRPQVLRAYDDRGWIHPATRVHDGSDPRGARSRRCWPSPVSSRCTAATSPTAATCSRSPAA